MRISLFLLKFIHLQMRRISHTLLLQIGRTYSNIVGFVEDARNLRFPKDSEIPCLSPQRKPMGSVGFRAEDYTDVMRNERLRVAVRIQGGFLDLRNYLVETSGTAGAVRAERALSERVRRAYARGYVHHEGPRRDGTRCPAVIYGARKLVPVTRRVTFSPSRGYVRTDTATIVSGNVRFALATLCYNSCRLLETPRGIFIGGRDPAAAGPDCQLFRRFRVAHARRSSSNKQSRKCVT